MRAVSDKVGIIKGRLSLPGFGTSIEGMLDLRNPDFSDRVPEWGRSEPVPSTVSPGKEDAAPEFEIHHDPDQIPPARYHGFTL